MPVYKIVYKRPYSRLEANENLDGDPLAIRLIDETPEPGLRIYPGVALTAGRKIYPDHLPTKIMIGGGQRAITDFNADNGLLFVSPKFRSLIETLEPEAHQFFPVTLVDRKGDHLADHWFWIVCNGLDSVDRENTTFILQNGTLWRPARDLKDDELPPGTDRNLPAKLAFNSKQIGGAHFWRDKYLTGRPVYCSEQAAAEIDMAELTGVELVERESV